MTFFSPSGSTPSNYRSLLLLCCGVAFAAYLGSHMRLPVVPLYARSLGASTAEVGFINSAFFLVAGLLSLPLGILSDRIGRKLLVCFGLFILSGTSFLLYFSRTTQQMIAIYVLFGMGLAAFGPTMMSFVADFTPPTHLGRSYGWYTTALYTAMSVGPATGGFVAERLGFLAVFLISGVFVFATLVMTFVFLPRARQVLLERPPKPKTSVIAKELLRNRALLGCWLATFGGCFGAGMFFTFFPLYGQDRGLRLDAIGVVFAAQAVTNALLRIPLGQLSDRVARRSNLVVIGYIGFAAALAGFALGRGFVHFLIIAVALGSTMALSFTALGALIAEVVPPAARGLAMGGYNTCIYLGMMASSSAMGTVIDRLSFELGFALTAALVIVITLGFFFMVKGFSARAGEVTEP